MDFRVISIGALAANPIWGERSPARAGHATTTLVRSGKAVILVDPALPEQVLLPRLHERAGLRAKDVTHVFLTRFSPEHTRGLAAFGHAKWLIHGPERESVGVQLATALKDMMTRSESQGGVAKDESLRSILENDVGLLSRCEAAPESLADRVDLFPLPGVSPGCCGLLISHPRHTLLVAGDSVPTQEHAEQGKVMQGVGDMEQAKASFEEAIEIADLIVPGRDNVFVNPTKKPF
ncbi:MAG TPA: MBL fold metallo-hydrolase [Phycisphaerales bacterium]|nr:MBL fold metallo-hydrolase [Phycisphaerales bacterium]